MKVEIKATRVKGIINEIKRIIEIDIKGTQKEVRNAAELKFLNSYINRDCFIGRFNSLSQAKKIAGLKIESRVL